MSHPRTEIDDLIHSPVRFSIMSALVAGDKVQFGFVRDLVEVSDSSLSQHLSKLEAAGYVAVTKDRGTRTWLRATDTGRSALDRHVALLNRIASGEAVPTTTPTVVD